ncbi:MAG: carbon-nitrogen hydrolase family protein, partial [Kiritimatiellae bacterium]|nr:carbon-nitrogen hydrolase family protein [Kiritimatiellia bacterium]
MTKRLSITLVQNAAGRDRQANLARIESLLGRSVRTNLVVLPEVFALRGSDEDYRGGAEPIPGPLTDCLSAWARRWNAWVLAGSVLERDGDAIFNTSVLIDEVGDVVATYRKIHLFEAHLDTGQVVREADLYSAGREPVLVDIDGWQCGLSICYDLRFPELYRYYAGYGAQALFIPSNFTQRTGKDHWEVLARARAIENQC